MPTSSKLRCYYVTVRLQGGGAYIAPDPGGGGDVREDRIVETTITATKARALARRAWPQGTIKTQLLGDAE